jgi:hypothetical protein
VDTPYDEVVRLRQRIAVYEGALKELDEHLQRKPLPWFAQRVMHQIVTAALNVGDSMKEKHDA